MFKKRHDLAIKGKTDEELELELKKQTLRAKLYFFVIAIVLIALVAAFKLVKNFQEKKAAEEPAEEAIPEEGIILIPENGEGSSNEEGFAPQSEAPPQEDEGEYYIFPEDSSGDSESIIIEESDPGDSGPQEEIIEY